MSYLPKFPAASSWLISVLLLSCLLSKTEYLVKIQVNNDCFICVSVHMLPGWGLHPVHGHLWLFCRFCPAWAAQKIKRGGSKRMINFWKVTSIKASPGSVKTSFSSICLCRAFFDADSEVRCWKMQCITLHSNKCQPLQRGVTEFVSRAGTNKAQFHMNITTFSAHLNRCCFCSLRRAYWWLSKMLLQVKS